ncbi:kinase-like protein [Auriculariales sp. MPI-PUGE-AT-0066]|nr:kinase-like protein [Auriculariales sp. MPI-PUGE-AT-0066]
MLTRPLSNSGSPFNLRKYKTEEFAVDVLRIVREVGVPSWVHVHALLRPEDIKIVKVSGSLTNAVFFVSAPAHTTTKTFLLRVYGPSSGNLISRADELRMLHLLSGRYRIGPRLYGTFTNGRLEEYFDSDALTPEEMRDPTVSSWIARRMAEMHRVDIDAVVGPSWTIAAIDNVQKWLAPAREVLDLVGPERTAELGLDLDRFVPAWTTWQQKVYAWEAAHGASPRVFAHNDAQYGNLLKLRKVSRTKPAHHQQIIVVDFEYAGPNPAAVDIANHFQEWTTAYNSTTPHLLHPEAYPSLSERRNFYSAYLGGDSADWTRLEDQVRVWSAASHGMWAIWSLVQAREQVEAGQANALEDFDYLGYASSRLSEFYRLVEDLSSI